MTCQEMHWKVIFVAVVDVLTDKLPTLLQFLITLNVYYDTVNKMK